MWVRLVVVHGQRLERGASARLSRVAGLDDVTFQSIA
jgi:hypothetical protein